jgi:hypothetical protein
MLEINSGHPSWSESFQLCGKGGQSHILRLSKRVGVTIESYGKVEISYINVDNRKKRKRRIIIITRYDRIYRL